MDKIEETIEKTARAARPRVVPPQDVGLQTKADPKKIVPLSKAVPKPVLDERLVAYSAPQSVEAELFKILRTSLLFPNSGQPPRVILVTSAIQGDGKSFVSSNLAASISQGVEEHVLLIDADIRNPMLHTYFGLGVVGGLSEYLAHDEALPQYISKTAIPKLSIIAGGKPSANPTELITSRKMKALLEEARQRYDNRYIIIDSPPMSIAAETHALAKYADGVIMVVRAGKTPRREVATAVEQLGRDKLLGIVLNDSDHSLKKYYGYQRYQRKTENDA